MDADQFMFVAMEYSPRGLNTRISNNGETPSIEFLPSENGAPTNGWNRCLKHSERSWNKARLRSWWSLGLTIRRLRDIWNQCSASTQPTNPSSLLAMSQKKRSRTCCRAPRCQYCPTPHPLDRAGL